VVRTLAIVLLLAASALTVGRPTHAAAFDLYADFLQKSGLSKQADLFEAVIDREIATGEERFGRLDAQQRAMLRRAAAQSYAADKLRDALRARLSESLSTDDATRALAWLDSPLGTRIVRLEESASAAMAQTSQADDMAAKAFASLSSERKALLERMMQAADASATVTNITVNQVLGVARGFAALAGKSQADINAEMSERLPLIRAQIKGAIEPALVAFAAITYAALTDDEIRQYLSFIESETGRRVTAAVNAALDAALTAAAIDFGQRIARDAASEAAKLNRT